MNPDRIIMDDLRSVGEVMKEAYSRGWITRRDGNISYNFGEKEVYVTPSGEDKTSISPGSLVKFELNSEGRFERTSTGMSKPSIEFDMHEKIHLHVIGAKKKNKKLSSQISVVHLHPTNTVALMYKISRKEHIPYNRKWTLASFCDYFPEIRRYTNVGASIEFREPGSQGLADDTYEAFLDHKRFEKAKPNAIGFHADIIGMEGHGVTAVGATPWDAFEHVERLEHICEIILKSGVSLDD